MDDILVLLIGLSPLSFLGTNKRLHQLSIARLSKVDAWISEYASAEEPSFYNVSVILARSHRYLTEDQRLALRKHFSDVFLMEYSDPFPDSVPTELDALEYSKEGMLWAEEVICPVCKKMADPGEEGFICWGAHGDLQNQVHQFAPCTDCGRITRLASWSCGNCDICTDWDADGRDTPRFFHRPKADQRFFVFGKGETIDSASMWEWECTSCGVTHMTHCD